jgi:alkyl hydroperoxide reductase subunit AhpF
VLGTDGVEGVRIRNNKTNEVSTLDISGFFVAIGHQPNTDIFKGWLDLDESGYIKAVPGRSLTNIPRRFCLWRCAGQNLSPSRDSRRHGLYGGFGCGAVFGGEGALIRN